MKFILILIVLSVMVGCQNRKSDPQLATQLYPMDLHRAHSVPIQVTRQDSMIEIVNSTATDYEESLIWVNQRFTAPLPQLQAGATIQFNLWNLRDVYGEQLNAGGFWRTDRPTPIVIVELQTSEEAPLVGLVYIKEE